MSFGETLHRPALRTSERDRRCSQRANLQMSSILGIVLISVCALFIPNSSKRRLGYSPEPVVEGASRWSSERRTLPEHMLQRRGHKGFRPIFDSFTSAVGGGISGRPAYESTRDATRTGKAFAKAGGASGDAVSNKSTSRTTRGRPGFASQGQKLSNLCSVIESRRNLYVLRGGREDRESKSDDSCESDDGRQKKRNKRGPGHKLEKYKKMVKKLEDAKLRLENRISRIAVVRKSHVADSVRIKSEIKQKIEALKDEIKMMNSTVEELDNQTLTYLQETPHKLTNLKSLKAFQTELQGTLSRLTMQKFKLVKEKAILDANKENVLLKSQILALEAKIEELGRSHTIAKAKANAEKAGWTLQLADD
eukprot:CAMPEP_0167741816 /NCGR_PEP_ID=MMETSP0110_2-20121227/1071_1 /TAXON_ID=629695 /ORGANISM="Gymnochlora sp., Strain CCMP2014" /LENGTH=364 /DNA_ID=CAMNT_0007625919 /DNA_START=1244 /DNA_END=2335 /DNA_ORIENTATION=-